MNHSNDAASAALATAPLVAFGVAACGADGPGTGPARSRSARPFRSPASSPSRARPRCAATRRGRP